MGGLWLPVDGRKVFLLAVGEKAFAQFRIRTRGEGGHGSVPEHEHSAVIDLAKAVIAIGERDPPATVQHLTPRSSTRSSPTRASASASRTRRWRGPPLASCVREPEVAGLVEPLLGATFTPTMLDAG